LEAAWAASNRTTRSKEQLDQRPGHWTKLQLVDMDVALWLRMRRAHPERLAQKGQPQPVRAARQRDTAARS
jgi:hypothetical protein